MVSTTFSLSFRVQDTESERLTNLNENFIAQKFLFCSSRNSGYDSFSAVKISALTQEINFSSLTVLKIFNAGNAGMGLGLATPPPTAASVSFFLEKNCVYLDAESIYERTLHFASATAASQTSAEMVQMTRSFSRTTVNCGLMRCCQAICQ